jgi:AraC-like DNA-binding protein
MSVATVSFRPVLATDGGALGAFLSDVHSQWPAEAAVLLTTLPRGGLQVAQAAPNGRASETDEKLAWQALTNGFASDANRLAVRVEGPILGGYPGVILLRSVAPLPPVSADVAERVRATFVRSRAGGSNAEARQAVFVFGQSVLPTDLEATFGPSLASALRQLAASEAEDGRHTLVDADGRVTAVQLARRPEDATLGGTATFISLPPRAGDWAELTPDDFAADPEMARLAGAIHLAVEQFRRGPTLDEIASVVGLSPFHFHRRFTERFGLTPKHLLFDLQLEEAERLLSDPSRALTDIAETCGFAHQSHFTSRFKQGTGLTPTAWRRKLRA